MITIDLAQNIDTAEEAFLQQWNKLGEALIFFNAGKVNLKISGSAVEESPPTQPGVRFGPPGWAQMTAGGKLKNFGDVNLGALYPNQPSARVVLNELKNINCVSGRVEIQDGLPIVLLTVEGIQQLTANRGLLRFVFLDT